MSATPPNNRKTALAVVGIILGMFCLAYASVPLYSMFCKVTGYGGTTRVANTLPTHTGSREFIVRFNADTDPNLPWKFMPEQEQVKVVSGENALIFYKAENTANAEVHGMATYNVTPESAGPYFNKIQCFCFNQQVLAPGQKVDMPVSFFIDPAIDNDPETKNIKTITLSYTFFKVKQDKKG